MPLKKSDQFILFLKVTVLLSDFNTFAIEWTEFLDRAFRSIIPTILGEPNDNRTCLDIGCGPSISNVISGRYKIQTKIFFQHFKIFLCVNIIILTRIKLNIWSFLVSETFDKVRKSV